MDVNDLKGLFAEVNKRMDVALERVKHDLAGVRTGRASTALLDHVHVEAYGSKMPLNQVAGLSIPEPTLIVVQPFDPSLLAGGRARDPHFRSRSESGERRQGHSRPDSVAHRRTAQGALTPRAQARRGRTQHRARRAARRERPAEETAEGLEISEDDERKGLDEVQKITDQHVKLIDDAQKKKDADLLGH